MVPWYSGYVFLINFHSFVLFLLVHMCVCVLWPVGRRRQGEKLINHLNAAHDYCRTSADLFKTVFDLLVSVTVFVGRFDMRMMQVWYL